MVIHWDLINAFTFIQAKKKIEIIFLYCSVNAAASVAHKRMSVTSYSNGV